MYLCIKKYHILTDKKLYLNHKREAPLIKEFEKLFYLKKEKLPLSFF